MNRNYCDEENVHILISLLKQNNIRKIIASPGTTNAAFVRSIQVDNSFEIFSCVDERSAAYMACGMAAESNEPVVITCTGATASRNYLPGLTEAFHRKLPVLAVTGTRDISKYGHLEDQVIDRTVKPKDAAKITAHIPIVKDDDDRWECVVKINEALGELTNNGGGPVHINLTTNYTRTYTTKEIPDFRKIDRIKFNDKFPEIKYKKVGIYIGSHKKFCEETIKEIDKFCEIYDAVVFCDHTSNYYGKNSVNYLLTVMQEDFDKSELMPELLIHFGEISGFYHQFVGIPKEVWRISPDGKIRDTFLRLTKIFSMDEKTFFSEMNNTSAQKNNRKYFNEWNEAYNNFSKKLPDIPFSNVWVAQQLSKKLPDNSVIHFGILNSLSSWNYFKLPESVTSNSNVGGYGIDGCLSTLLGAALCNPEKLYFIVLGDLAFFYDMNSLGNRHLPPNIKIIVINNGKGMEFKIKNNPAAQFGDETDDFIAASGHFGNKSKVLIKSYVESLGIEYTSCSNKRDFEESKSKFIDSFESNKPFLMEVFTDDESEDVAQKIMKTIEPSLKGSAIRMTKGLIGDSNMQNIKKIITNKFDFKG